MILWFYDLERLTQIISYSQWHIPYWLQCSHDFTKLLVLLLYRFLITMRQTTVIWATTELGWCFAFKDPFSKSNSMQISPTSRTQYQWYCIISFYPCLSYQLLLCIFTIQLRLSSDVPLISYLFEIHTFTYKTSSFYEDYNYDPKNKVSHLYYYLTITAYQIIQHKVFKNFIK